ncbi:MAG: hypothetical protein FWG11_00150 [Promicromonosporaceae bacterium]|nr:hypothetical protein [Promicromonosporaceae bacterium]
MTANANIEDLIERQAGILVTTGTGGGQFADFETEYKGLDQSVCRRLATLQVVPPFPWRSLWEWHGYYSQNLSTYASRRQYIATLKNDALTQIEMKTAGTVVHDPAGVSNDGWSGIDLRVRGLIDEYTSARDLDSWQDVGRRSREILIDLGKLIADPDIVPNGQDAPKAADARAWFDLVLNHHGGEQSRRELRALMRKSWDLAQKVTHGTVDDIDAFAAAQATVLLVRTTQKLHTDNRRTESE